MRIKQFNEFINEAKTTKMEVAFSFNASSIAKGADDWWDSCQKELKKKAIETVEKKLQNKAVKFVKSSVNCIDCDLDNKLVTAEVTLSGEFKDLDKIVGNEKFFFEM